MKHKQFYRIFSFLLSILLILTALPISTVAETAATEVTAASVADGSASVAVPGSGSFDAIGSTDTEVLRAGEKTLAELQAMTVDLTALPEVLNADHALEKGHVNRLHAQEGSLSTIVYQNRDGSKTTYLFSQNVKYIDENGAVRDKSTAVSPILNATYSHAMLNNSTKVYFGKQASAGTRIEFGSYAIGMTPKNAGAVSAEQQTDGSIVYWGVFGNGTAVRYQTELNGLKEDVILIHNVGRNEFEFTMQVEGATPVQIDGAWYFQNADGETVATLGRIWVKDSVGHTTEGEITVMPTTERNTYSVRISVAESFLDDPTTVYPVYIDPTTYIWETDSYIVEDSYDFSYDSILDTGIYSTEAERDTALASSDYHTLKNDSMIVYRFPGFYGTYTWDGETYHYSSNYNLTAEQIGSVTLYIEERENLDLYLHVSGMTDTWDTATLGENPVALCDPALLESYSEELLQWYILDYEDEDYREIDVTAIFREWARYNTFEREGNGTMANPFLNPAHGLALINDTNNPCEITAADVANTTDNVYVVIDTSYLGGTYCIEHPQSGHFLYTDGTESYTPQVTSIGEQTLESKFIWRVEYQGNNGYYLYSAVDPEYMLFASGTNLSLRKFGGVSSRYLWTVSVSANGKRIFKHGNYALRYDGTELSLSTVPATTDTINYQQVEWLPASDSRYVPMTGFEITSPDWVIVSELDANGNPKDLRRINITVSENASFANLSDFTWKSSDTTVATVDENGYVRGISPGTAVITLTHKVTSISNTLTVRVMEVLEDGIYFLRDIQPMQTKYYLSPETTQTNMGTQLRYCVEKQTFSPQTQQWRITHLGSGYYSIQSVANGGYLSVYNASSVEGALICLESTFSESSCSWAIVGASYDAYKILSKCGRVTDQCLAGTLNGGAGTNFQQTTYTNDRKYNDEWYLYKVQYEATINNYYDQGYLVKYSLTAQQAVANIQEYSNCAAEKYMIEFGLLLTVNIAQYYNSPLDQCEMMVADEDGRYLCMCGENHSNRENAIASFQAAYNGGPTVTNIYWTGHTLVSVKGLETFYNRSCSYGYTVYMLDMGASSAANTLVHELAHQYGVKDHYHEIIIENGEEKCVGEDRCNDCNGAQGRDSGCVMDMGTIYTYPSVLCADCRTDLETHLQNHHVFNAS